ncbi:hypothetical protein ACWENR_28850 [Micromonospora sp. NPDC004336]
MFFDPEDPTSEPACGCRRGRMWRMSRAWRKSRHPQPQSLDEMIAGARHGASALIEYAQAQVDAADAILTRHDEVGLGLCRCGRPHPCPERRQWIGLRAHYVPLLKGPP